MYDLFFILIIFLGIAYVIFVHCDAFTNCMINPCFAEAVIKATFLNQTKSKSNSTDIAKISIDRSIDRSIDD